MALRERVQIVADSGPGVGEEALPAEAVGETGGPDVGQDVRVQAREPDGSALLRVAPLTLHHHLERRILDVEDAAEVEHENARLVLGHEFLDPVADLLGIGKEQPAFRPQDQEAFEGFVIRVVGRQRAQDVLPPLATDHVDRRIRGLARQTEQRQDDGNQNALQGSEDEHAEEGRERPMELHGPGLADRRELGGLDQADRIDDHDRREHRLRQKPEQGRQNQHRRGRGRRGDERRLLRPPSDRADDRRLRCPAARGHGAEQGAGQVCRACRQKFPVGADRRIGRDGEGAARGDRFGETHQGDTDRPGHQAA